MLIRLVTWKLRANFPNSSIKASIIDLLSCCQIYEQNMISKFVFSEARDTKEIWIDSKDVIECCPTSNDDVAQGDGNAPESVFELKYLGSRLVESTNNEDETTEAIRIVRSKVRTIIARFNDVDMRKPSQLLKKTIRALSWLCCRTANATNRHDVLGVMFIVVIALI